MSEYDYYYDELIAMSEGEEDYNPKETMEESLTELRETVEFCTYMISLMKDFERGKLTSEQD